ncbi:hypothetical protein QVD17_19236 [Tagetes erecta]|uniref:TF-B3 domain-containing protein n=1 Tax=Tagetes erecta TaxID=13708 RepID=A0AAD8KQL4_TARER|nr:hypothetical protein QVD17_19236 [Tagetes erecta]
MLNAFSTECPWPCPLQLQLPHYYDLMVSHANWPSGKTIIETLDMFQWEVTISLVDGKYYIIEGWKTLISQILINEPFFIIFDYEKGSNITMYICPKTRFFVDSIMYYGKLFVSDGQNAQVLPEGFLRNCNYKFLYELDITLTFPKAPEPYTWKVHISRVGTGYRFTDGWNLVLQDLDLYDGMLMLISNTGPIDFELRCFLDDGLEYFMEQPQKKPDPPEIVFIESDSSEHGMEDVALNDQENEVGVVNVDEHGDMFDEMEVFEEAANDEAFGETAEAAVGDQHEEAVGEQHELAEIEVNVDVNTNTDDEWEEIDEDYHLSCEITVSKRLRFPADFARTANFTKDQPIDLLTNAGDVFPTVIRKELSEGKPRFTVSRWDKFVQANGIQRGSNCLLLYYPHDSELVVIHDGE